MAIELSLIGRYETGVFDESAAEIPAYDPTTEQLFVTNSDSDAVDVLSLSDPTNPTLVTSLDISSFGGGVNSVAVNDGVVAVAVEAEDETAAGQVVFFSTAGVFLSAVTVGVLPDNLAFTPDGTKVVVANEGEQVFDDDDNLIADPEGSISIIDVSGDVTSLTAANVTNADFSAFVGQEATLRAAGVRILSGTTAAEDFEPEFVAVSPDSTTAFVTLQENNAFAVVDLTTGTITDILPAGTVDFSSESALDASNEDGVINITNYPVKGFRQPDAIASYEVDGQTYYVTANEGDGRDAETDRVADLTLDASVFTDAATLQLEENLGRLEVSIVDGDTDSDGAFEELFAFGSRSFSIFDASGNVVFDSADAFEQITAADLPVVFNSTNDENITFDDRSDDAGPEPEGVTIGVVNDVPYAFVGLERIGGVMVYDISDPTDAEFVQYINTRDFSGDPEAGTAGDLGPEGLAFIAADDSPLDVPLLAVTNEVSGSTSIFAIDFAPVTVDPPASLDVDITLINVDVTISTTIIENNTTFVFTGSNTFNYIVTTVDVDIIVAGGGADIVVCGDGDDDADGGGGDDTILCGDGDDDADGGNGGDEIRGQNGNDKIRGGRGRDKIYGGDGDDECDGEEGSDTIAGGDGDDDCDGGDRSDKIGGGKGNDTLAGGNGKDNIRGGADDDIIDGGNGKDSIFCGTGDDEVEGGNGGDFLNGGNGDDNMSGDNGRDSLTGGGGDDMMVGGNGDDSLNGGDDDDILYGGGGSNICIGGAGSDIFMIESLTVFNVIFVTDFNVAEDSLGLSIDIDFEDLTIEQAGSSVEIAVNGETVALIENLEVTSVTEDSFVTM